MKKIILVLAVLIAVMACSKTTEPVKFQDQLTELCEDYGYMWKSTIDRDYYVPTYNVEPDRDFEDELSEITAWKTVVNGKYFCYLVVK